MSTARSRSVQLAKTWPGDTSVNVRIHDQLAVALMENGISLAIDGALEESFSNHVGEILSETFEAIGTQSDDNRLVTVQYDVTADFEQTSHRHADQGRHPAEPLMAAEILFGVALPALAEALGKQRKGDVVKLSTALHHAIWRRFPPGAIAYVEYLLMKLANAHRDERVILARELHDRVAHRLAVGLQRIELVAQSTTNSPEFMHLATAHEELKESLIDLQDIGVALRQRVGDRDIADALHDFVARLPDVPRIRVNVAGRPVRLFNSVAEEVFTIVLEAIRNARRHAKGASVVRVQLTWTPSELMAQVSDDGHGAIPKRMPAGAFGVLGMNERAEVIGGSFSVYGTATGTRVELRLPLTRVADRV